MKIIRIISVLLILIVVFICCKQSTKKEVSLYNGISQQILNIVDSLPVCEEGGSPFVTVRFSTPNDSDYIIRFMNFIVIPAPPEPPAPIKEILLSEYEDFIGYKKCGDRYLVFLEYFPNKKLEKFIERDSLIKDEEPFRKYNIYEWKKKDLNCDHYEWTYRINARDSLVFVEQKQF